MFKLNITKIVINGIIIAKKLRALFEKYHTFEKPLTMKEIINALSKTLKVSFDENEQNRVKNMYYDWFY